MIVTKKRSLKQRQNRWLFAGVTAMTLAVIGMNGTVARADTAADAASITQVEATPTPTESPAVETPTVADPTTTGESPANDGITPDNSVTEPTNETTETTTGETPVVDETPAAPAPDTTGPETTTEPVVTPEPDVTDEVTDAVTEVPVDDAEVPVDDVVTAPTPVDPDITPEVSVPQPTQIQRTSAPVNVPELNFDDEDISVWMPNEKLQQLVLGTLNGLNTGQKWAEAADIKKTDMALLTRLSGGDITYNADSSEFSIKGLEYAVNLEYIMLQSRLESNFYGHLVDITPLAGLTKLKTVELSHNRIQDITPLAGLVELERAGLVCNHIADFSPLKDLPNLTSVGYTDQVIFLPTVYISKKDRTAHLAITCRYPDGTMVELEGEGIALPIKYTSGPWAMYQLYFSGGDGTPDGNGGVNYVNIQDQKPGATEYPGISGIPVDVQDEYYFLTGRKVGINVVEFSVVQPYILTDEAEDVTAKYQDENGEEIHADVIHEGLQGEDYTTEQLDIPGYTFKEVQGNVTGKFTDEAQTVVYVYTQDQGAPVTATYQDEAGNKIHEDVIHDGVPGAEYTTEQLNIPGYTFKEVQGNVTGTITDEAQTVTYIYSVNDAAPVTVKYQDDKGNPLQKDIILTGKPGEAYTTTQLDFDGYTFKTVTGETSGEYGDTPLTVVYVYVKDSTGGPGNPDPDPKPTPDPDPDPNPNPNPDPDPNPGPEPTPDPDPNPGTPEPDKPNKQKPGTGAAGDQVVKTPGKQTTVKTSGQGAQGMPAQALGKMSTTGTTQKAGEPMADLAATKAATTLPQTDEQASSSGLLVGIAGLMAGVLGWFGWRKRD